MGDETNEIPVASNQSAGMPVARDVQIRMGLSDGNTHCQMVESARRKRERIGN
jgi:hypothetical protein